jgi:outer membrane protein assembly factor BamE (lipoprotein component of BamABCDE complex)
MTKLIIVSLTTVFVFTACSTFSKAREQNLEMVHVGQSKAQLIDTLGKPDAVEMQGSMEMWHYEIYSADNRRIYPYTASFENEHLAKWSFDTARNQDDVRFHRDGRSPSSFNRY